MERLARTIELAMTVLRLLYSGILVMSLLVREAVAESFIDFNIPAGPLDVALASFGRLTKEQLLLDAAITDGKRSSAVTGRFTPEAALRQMLFGTGLVVRSVDGQGYAVAALADGAGRQTTAASRFEGYSAQLQTALGNALCSQPDTVPGGYRTMVHLWIGAAGAVDHAELVTSSGDAQRDARIKGRFRGLAIGVPPAGLPQPVTLLITSEGASADYCARLDRPPQPALIAR